MQAKNKSILALGAIFSLVILPATTFAHTGEPPHSEVEFCSRFSTIGNKMSQHLAELSTKYNSHHSEVKNKLKERDVEHTKKVKEIDEVAKGTLEQHFEDIEEEAVTEAQKQAVAVFKMNLKSAQEVRKIAVEKAQTTFRSARDQLVTQRHNAHSAAVTTFRNSIQTATQKAKTDCAAGISPEIVKQNFVASIKVAKEKLHADIKAVDKTDQQMEALTKIRNEAIRQAHQDFKRTLDLSNRDTLKAAFPNN